MLYRNNKTHSFRAMTLVETLIAMALMAIICAVLVAQFRLINNSWDSKVGASETLQNGRALIDHLNRNLSTASRITAVSDSSETNGYIEFIDNDANNVRYDVNSISDYAQFGLIGSPSDLAGPVSKLQFTCYDAFGLSTPITDVNSIRSVKVETTLTNLAMLDQDMAFSTQAYIRTNALPRIFKSAEPWLEFDTAYGHEPALCQLGPTEYLCAYRGSQDDGFARILNVDTIDWSVSASSALEFDATIAELPDLATVDNSHALCVYQGDKGDGWGCILDASARPNLVVQGPFEFDTKAAYQPVLCQIDNTHFLCVYQGFQFDGTAVILSVDTASWATTVETPFEFDISDCQYPEIIKIDDTHYLCTYFSWGAGKAVVLTVDPATWTVTNEIPFEFSTGLNGKSALAKLDNTHVLCAYRSNTRRDSNAQPSDRQSEQRVCKYLSIND
ncbi:MAG: type II secretion system protein [Planctomycetes bacterium]|nr:type II secretion system protein [Planctomycetota bacterium]